MTDHYAVLGVPRNATHEVLKAAYRRLCKMFHPDKNPGNATAEARMKDINNAWEVLGDDEKRKAYDAAWSRKAEEQAASQRAQAQQQQTGPAASTGTNQAEWWSKNWGWVLAGVAVAILFLVALCNAGNRKTRTQFA